jgi:hypothetical protein
VEEEMSDPRRDFGTERESSLADVIDLAGRRIMSGLIVAGLAVGIGLYSQRQPEPAKYQIVATERGIHRLNTESGYVTTCEDGNCWRTLRPGSADIRPRPEAAPAPAAQPRLNAPAASPPARQAVPAPAGGNAQ